MNEQEKEAIKILNNINLLYCGREDERAIETILNLVDKQQKKIEELKHDNSIICEIAYKRRQLPYTMVYTGTDNYISKDKIRHIRDKAECMDYYSLNDVIDDLTKLIGE